MRDIDGAEGVSHPVVVWDLPTRVFHAFLVVFVVVDWATGEDGGGVFAIHRIAGYGLLAALLFRVVWGFAGSRHSRFSDFLRPWPAVRDYARRLIRLDPPHYVGHNPLGGWMVMAMLATLAAVVVSGLFAGGEEGAGGPFAALLSPALARAVAELHGAIFDVLIVLVVIHVCGVVVDWLLTGENLIRAMWDGRKNLPEAQARQETPPVPAYWGLLVATVAVATVWFALV